MKKYILLLIALYPALLLHAGNINLDFPKFANQTLKIYYFEGNHADSLSIALNADGKGIVRLPAQIHKGMMRLFVNNKGGFEFIGGEDDLRIICQADIINKETVSFPGSEENKFLYETFERKSQWMEQQNWLIAGSRLYEANTSMINLIKQEEEDVVDLLKQLNDSVSHSSLYAARFLQWADFMSRLYVAEQLRNVGNAALIRGEMETSSDIASLYTSGQLWGNVQNYYISMFNRIDAINKQEDYAASINKIAGRLSGNIREGFFAGAIQECERFGWDKAEKIIINEKDMITRRYEGLEESGVLN